MGALYDAMGKYLDVPAHKIMGQKVRDRVPVAAWTRPASPEDFALEIQRAAAEGHKYFKMHTCAHHCVIEQTRAAEEVAPDGFKVHYDFNHNRTETDTLRIIDEVERSSVVGILQKTPSAGKTSTAGDGCANALLSPYSCTCPSWEAARKYSTAAQIYTWWAKSVLALLSDAVLPRQRQSCQRLFS